MIIVFEASVYVEGQRKEEEHNFESCMYNIVYLDLKQSIITVSGTCTLARNRRTNNDIVVI